MVTVEKLKADLSGVKGELYLPLSPFVDDSPMAIGARIREYREAAQLTQEQLATELGVSGVSVSTWERGIYTPSKANLKKVAGILGTSEAMLRYGEVSYSAGHSGPESPRASGTLQDHRNATGRFDLRPEPYKRVFGYLEQMRAAGMPEPAIDEARRYLVDSNFGRINKRDYRERSDDEVIMDIDAMWAALKIRFERDWGVKL